MVIYMVTRGSRFYSGPEGSVSGGIALGQEAALDIDEDRVWAVQSCTDRAWPSGAA